MRRAWIALASASLACAAPDPAGDDAGGEDTGGSSPAAGDEPLEPLHPRPAEQRCRMAGTPDGALPRRVAEPLADYAFVDAVQILAGLDGGLWVVEASGEVWAVDDPDAGTPARRILDLRDRVDCCASRGLLAVASRSELGGAPAVLVHYHRAEDPTRTRVARLAWDPVLDLVEADSEVLVLELAHDGVAASGGGLAFDASGMLLVGVGDDLEGAPANPSSSPARDLGDLRGGILRLDVSDPVGGYAIPADNPFVGRADARPELFALGVHDPRGCFTDGRGRSWCSDRGGGQREELDAITAAADLGWPIVEGFSCAAGECEPTLYDGPHAEYGLVDPDGELDHCELIAGYGHAGGDAEGVLLFGDRCSGRGFGLRSKVGPGAVEIIAAVAPGIQAIGPDAAGQPWIVDGQGRLARLAVGPGGEPGTLPRWLSQTECFELASGSDTVPAPDLVPYTVASPLWSDGLLKRRYLVVPPGERVTVLADGRWRFPEGSVLIKTFIHEAELGDPSSRRPIETRFMVRRNGAWEFHGYRWDAAGEDAELLDAEAEVELITDAGADELEFSWTFPDRIGCQTCHGFAGGRPLGPITAQLNRVVRYGEGEPEDQLTALLDLGLLAPEPGLELDPRALEALADPRDELQPLGDRARAYLHANCSHCHRPAWMRPDLRATTPLAEAGLCEPIEFPSPWVGGDQRVVPGAPEQSNLWLRMGTRGFGQMPQLGTATVDPLGHSLVGEWIAGLVGCDG